MEPIAFYNMRKNISDYIAITDEVWQIISPYLTIKNIKKNEILIEAGNVCQYIYYINTGIIRFFTLQKIRRLHLVLIFGVHLFHPCQVASCKHLLRKQPKL